MSAEGLTDEALAAIAGRCRKWIVSIGHNAGGYGAHFGPALSLVEIMTVLYGVGVRQSPDQRLNSERDRVILSKGHGSLALYAALHEFGYIDQELLVSAERDGTLLPGQPVRNRELGIEFSSGTLGMGLSFGVGLALSARMMKSERGVYVLMGDGETNEGSVWEAAMSAAHFGLSRLIAIVDVNRLQSDGRTAEIMSCSLRGMWEGFGWDVIALDGHSIPGLRVALQTPISTRPRCILASTVKGKGVSFMEDAAEWHHGLMTEGQFETACGDVGRRASAP
ncbi:transketolase [uncultured Thiodictyon sp.]|uniref:transketolase n=1 Tax=uncultured Thiodictyon sp. TaxID=1846217 RepID=UPI0025F89E6B|nr:transketolase [uncultured Thiodictyon sp.]